ncbi:MAG: hypothetical protein M1833_003716 [Piccolia ochrophora]|nr:MAG: hypothetical protein M1833_003716 [Piccolia ochrophora]
MGIQRTSSNPGFLKRLSIRRSKIGSKSSKHSSEHAEDPPVSPHSSGTVVHELEGGNEVELAPPSSKDSNEIALRLGPEPRIDGTAQGSSSRELYRLFSEMENVLGPLRELHDQVLTDPDTRLTTAAQELDHLNIGAMETVYAIASSLEKNLHDLPGDRNWWLLRARFLIRDYKAAESSFIKGLQTFVKSAYRKIAPYSSDREASAAFDNFSTTVSQLRDSVSSARWPLIQTLEYQYQTMFNAERRSTILDQLCDRVLEIERLQPQSPVSSAPQEVVISPSGDLLIDLASSPSVRFKVSSQVLTQASVFFDYAINPYHPKEVSERGPPPADLAATLPKKKAIRMADSSPTILHLNLTQNMTCEAFKTFLYAAHLRNDKVPRSVEFQEFVDIALVCSIYRCTAPVEIYVELLWLPQWRDYVGSRGYEDFLFISYVFGLDNIFEYTTKALLLKLRGKNWPEQSWRLPQSVWSRLRLNRARKLREILIRCRDTMHSFLPPPSSRPTSLVQDEAPNYDLLDDKDSLQLQRRTRCAKAQGNHECDAGNLGWLMLVLNEVGILSAVLDSRREDHFAYWEINSLSQILYKLCAAPSAAGPHGSACDYAPAFRNEMCDIYNSVKGLSVRQTNPRFADCHNLPANNFGGPPADDKDTEVVQTNGNRTENVALPSNVMLANASVISDTEQAPQLNGHARRSSAPAGAITDAAAPMRNFSRNVSVPLNRLNLAHLNGSTHSIVSTEVDIRTERCDSPSASTVNTSTTRTASASLLDHRLPTVPDSDIRASPREADKIYWSPKVDKEIITRADKELIISHKHLVSIGEETGVLSPRSMNGFMNGSREEAEGEISSPTSPGSSSRGPQRNGLVYGEDRTPPTTATVENWI